MRFLLAMAAALTVVAGTTRAGEVRIVAAENFYGGIAQAIGGNDVEVTSILSNPNQDPHEFTTSASTAKAVADADIVIYSGIDYDPWVDKLLGTGGKPDRTVICVASLIGAKPGDNPHIWYDPRTMPTLADKLVTVLTQRNPAKQFFYQVNAGEFKKAMDPVLVNIARLRASFQGTAVTATEPVFGYMADALGLKMLNYDFQVKIMNDTEPGAAETAAFEQSLRSKTAKMLFYNSQVTDPTTERLKGIARDSGIPVIGVTETQPPEYKSYTDWMQAELKAVEKGMKGAD
ncbi:MAG: zinc ABC transporter substrate-binding protein [Methylacidiphilales bacterium]|nr:zinc ABC transporter substrate-binding protein [Candidatus Methylacidiphilales bacterium]